MPRRGTSAASPIVEDDLDDVELDEELPPADGGEDLWDSDDDDEDEAAAAPPVSQLLGARTLAGLSARMRKEPLSKQANEWLLTTIGRLANELTDVSTTRDGTEIAADLKILLEQLEVRDLEYNFSDTTRALVEASIAALAADDVDDEDLDSGSAETLPPAEGPPPESKDLRISYLARATIHPDPDQPRTEADDELKASIARHGILEPIIVRPHPSILTEWMIVNGERRWQGSAGVLEELPCMIRHDQEDDAQRLVTQLVANTGKPLDPIEEARAFKQLLDRSNGTVQDLADALGRPRTTISERVSLLELGPWVPMIEAGAVPLTHAVRVLLAYRAAPEKAHTAVIESLEKDYRWTKRGGKTGAAAMSIGDFESMVTRYYQRWCYPLNKTSGYGKQPEFNTSKHDRECECGAPSIIYGYGDKTRRCCVDITWWGPLHRAAVKAKSLKNGTKRGAGDGPVTKQWVKAPIEGRATVQSYSSAPASIVILTDDKGNWDPAASINGGRGEPFDPADLEIDAKKLVIVTRGSEQYVGTKDVDAVKVARKAFADRVEGKVEAARDEFTAALEKATRRYAINGPVAKVFLSILLDARDDDGAEAVIEAAAAYEIELPKLPQWSYQRGQVVRKWAEGLKPGVIDRLATAAAAIIGEEIPLPSDAGDEEKQKLVAAIAKKAAPWRTAPAKESKASTPALAKSKKPSAQLKKSKTRGGAPQSRPAPALRDE